MEIELTVKIRGVNYADLRVGDEVHFTFGPAFKIKDLYSYQEEGQGGVIRFDGLNLDVEEDLSDANVHGGISHIVRDIELSELKQLLNQP